MPSLERVAVSFGSGDCDAASTALTHDGFAYPEESAALREKWRGLRDALAAGEAGGALVGEVVYLETPTGPDGMGALGDFQHLLGFEEQASVVRSVLGYAPAQATSLLLLIAMSLLLGSILGTAVLVLCVNTVPKRARTVERRQQLCG